MQKLSHNLSLAFIIASLTVPVIAHANPSGGKIIAGDAEINFTDMGKRLDINQQSQNAIIEWDSFSIDVDELVNFSQPSVDAIALNRIIGTSPSDILGQLTANGNVWIVNPNGVFFGKKASVDVGGLLATTLDIDDADFMGERYEFHNNAGSRASVINAGTISVTDAGLAALVGPHVENSGVVMANLGQVNLSAANGFTLDFKGDGKVNFLITNAIADAPDAVQDGADALIENSGDLISDGGQVIVSASTAAGVIDQVVNTSGLIRAQSLNNVNGVVLLDGGENGTVEVSGDIDAQGLQHDTDTGGQIDILGDEIEINSGAVVDASGKAGGGLIQVGGVIGGNISQRARETQLLFDSQVLANSLDTGDAGKIYVWGDENALFQGTVAAAARGASGDGGFIEISSGINLLVASSDTDVSSSTGIPGTVLFDPETLIVESFSGTLLISSDTVYEAEKDIIFNSPVHFFSGDPTNQRINISATAGENLVVNSDLFCTACNLEFSAGTDIILNSAFRVFAVVGQGDSNYVGGSIFKFEAGRDAVFDTGYLIFGNTHNLDLITFHKFRIEANRNIEFLGEGARILYGTIAEFDAGQIVRLIDERPSTAFPVFVLAEYLSNPDQINTIFHSMTLENSALNISAGDMIEIDGIYLSLNAGSSVTEEPSNNGTSSRTASNQLCMTCMPTAVSLNAPSISDFQLGIIQYFIDADIINNHGGFGGIIREEINFVTTGQLNDSLVFDPYTDQFEASPGNELAIYTLRLQQIDGALLQSGGTSPMPDPDPMPDPEEPAMDDTDIIPPATDDGFSCNLNGSASELVVCLDLLEQQSVETRRELEIIEQQIADEEWRQTERLRLDELDKPLEEDVLGNALVGFGAGAFFARLTGGSIAEEVAAFLGELGWEASQDWYENRYKWHATDALRSMREKRHLPGMEQRIERFCERHKTIAACN